MTTIQPRANYILVKQDEETSSVSEHGIASADQDDHDQKTVGKVIAIGFGMDDIMVGDKVIYGVYAGEKVSIKKEKKEEEFILLHDEDVLAKLCD